MFKYIQNKQSKLKLLYFSTFIILLIMIVILTIIMLSRPVYENEIFSFFIHSLKSFRTGHACRHSRM